MWSKIVEPTAGTGFEPAMNLLASDILILKSQALSSEDSEPGDSELDSDPTPLLLATAMVHAQSVSPDQSDNLESLMDELEAAMSP